MKWIRENPKTFTFGILISGLILAYSLYRPMDLTKHSREYIIAHFLLRGMVNVALSTIAARIFVFIMKLVFKSSHPRATKSKPEEKNRAA